MPQIYYENDFLGETTSSGTAGSLRFSNVGDGTPFEWAIGNPLEFSQTIFHCTGSKGSNEFLKAQSGEKCVESIWVISAIG
jgi:hypothetical protein